MTVIDRPTARHLPPRPDPVRAVIVHTTGRPDGLTDERHLERCIDFYTDEKGLGPHCLIALDGATYRFVDEARIAYHAKIGDDEAKLYRLGYQTWSSWRLHDGKLLHAGGEWSGYRDWRDTWLTGDAPAQSPLDLVTGDSPNRRSIGIELQQPAAPTASVFERVQYEALALLLLDVAPRHGLLLDRQHVLGHSDVNPITRSTARGGWDPGYLFSWSLLWDLVQGGAC